MKRVLNIKKADLENYLKQGLSSSQIAKIYNSNFGTICNYVREYGLVDLYSKKNRNPYLFKTIDTKEKAYLLGFIIADATIINKKITVSIALKDKKLAELLASIVDANIIIDLETNIKQRKFPNIRFTRSIGDISKFVGNEKKNERNVPIIRKDLEQYLVRGIFDADGCITWGYRKDRNRLWHKVSFTSSYNILLSVQKILYRQNISTIIRQKQNEKCFVLEFANKKDIIKFYNYLYNDKEFIPLMRKFERYNALRLELGENEETIFKDTISCQAVSHETEGVETTGGKMGSLNNQRECPSL